MLTIRKFVFTIAALVFLSSVTVLGIDYYYRNTQEIKTTGGIYAEGSVGSFVCFNPLFCQGDMDMDVGNLVFAGLGRYSPIEHRIVPDLASKWSISEDKLTYIFHLRKDLYWHDGEVLDADDVIFTYKDILQSEELNLSTKVSLAGVSIIKVDEYTIVMKLSGPDAFFLKNTTYPIMPQHLLGEVSFGMLPKSGFNLSPVGAGPFKFKLYDQQENSVTLTYFDKYPGEEPYIKEIKLYAFSDFDNLLSNVQKLNAIKKISSSSKLKIPDNFTLYDIEFPQYLALFLNHKNKLLRSSSIRDIINDAIDRFQLVQVVDNARVVSNPVFTYEPNELVLRTIDYEKIIQRVKDLGFELEGTVYSRENTITETKEYLKFNMLVLKNDEFIKVAQEIKKYLHNAGIVVDIVAVDIDEFKNKIRERDYDMLLSGQNIGSDFDLYPYWHSSQIDHPGLNVSMYANPETDKLLENIRTEIDGAKHVQLLKYLEQRLLKDKPAIFLYHPRDTMAVSDEIKDFNIEFLSTYKDRFSYMYSWYIKSKRAWKDSISDKSIILEEINTGSLLLSTGAFIGSGEIILTGSVVE